MEEQQQRRVALSATQILGGGLAAASAAFVASYFGVAGTVLGAAVMSIVATIGTALYAHWVERTADRLTQLAGPLFSRPELERVRPPRHLPWRRIAVGTVAAFAVGFGVVTVVELAAGKPLSSLLGRNDDRGTTLVPRRPAPAASAPSGGSSPSPSGSSPTGSPAPTASLRASPTPTVTTTPSPLPTSPPASPPATGTPTP